MKNVILLKDLTDKLGRIYYKEELEDQAVGKAFIGTFDFAVVDVNVDLSRASHFVTNIRVEGNDLIGDIDFIDTPMGIIAKTLVQEGVDLTTSIRATGCVNFVDGKAVVSDLTIFGFDLKETK